MKKKVAIFAFDGEPGCFVHALLNTLDMHERGYEVRLVIEGSATRLVRELADERPFAKLYERCREAGLIECVCRACAAKMESLSAAEEQRLTLCGEMSGHPSIARFLEAGYEVVVM